MREDIDFMYSLSAYIFKILLHKSIGVCAGMTNMKWMIALKLFVELMQFAVEVLSALQIIVIILIVVQ